MSALDVIAAAEKFRAELERQDLAALNAVIDTYQALYRRVIDKLDALLFEIADIEDMTRGKLVKMQRYQALMEQLEDELTRFGVFVEANISNASRAAIELAGRAAEGMALATFSPLSPAGIRWHRLPVDAIEVLLGFLQPDSALYQRIRLMAPVTADRVRSILLESIGLGYNPRKAARLIVNNGLGMGLTDALRLTRTAQLYSHREATRANYIANQEIVRGWVWWAHLDGDVCFLPGTLITTKRGDVPIEKVKIGDDVLTHTGKWRKVSNTMRRTYKGKFVTLSAGGKSIASTSNHPFLIERNGNLDWLRADEITVSDKVVVNPNFIDDQRDHVAGRMSVEGGIYNADNFVPPRFEPGRFSGVSFSDRFLTMPIDAIDFHNSINVGQKEVNRVSPTAKGMLLVKANTKKFKTNPDIFFRLGFARVFSIASWRTKLGIRLGGDDPELLLTSKTCVENRWPAADLGTVDPCPSALALKSLTASLAFKINSNFCFAGLATNSIPIGIRFRDSKTLVADRAYLNHPPASKQAILRTIFCRARSLVRKMLAAYFTGRGNALTFCGVVTHDAAIFPAAFSNLSFGYSERLAAENTSSIDHDVIISKYAQQVQLVDVFNLEVEVDHSYVANGFVVHNCLSCVANHGKVFDLDKTLNDHHNGRCVMLPLTDLGNPVEQLGAAWFESQPEATQKALMGQGKFEAWKANKFTFDRLTREVPNDVYGPMRSETPLKDLVKGQE